MTTRARSDTSSNDRRGSRSASGPSRKPANTSGRYDTAKVAADAAALPVSWKTSAASAMRATWSPTPETIWATVSAANSRLRSSTR